MQLLAFTLNMSVSTMRLPAFKKSLILALLLLVQSCWSSSVDSDWSVWSHWSPCSRSCGGGAATQSRRCLSDAGCQGETVRHKLCNLTPCPTDSTDFRALQCTEYDSIPYKGDLLTWVPVPLENKGDYRRAIRGQLSSEYYGQYDQSAELDGTGVDDPCALVCRSVDDDVPVVLSARVHDGTRCGEDGTLDMCIHGKCKNVGCDLQLDSYTVVDSCGSCGGNDTSCGKNLQDVSHGAGGASRTIRYRWEMRATSPCSATCGGGYQVVSGVCFSSEGKKVLDQYCDVANKPVPNIETCALSTCPTRWQLGEWGECSSRCGLGYQLREVYCLEPGGTMGTKVGAHHCTSEPRPEHRRPCNNMDCPRWYEGIWSECSVTCGSGTQTRSVHCKNSDGKSSNLCLKSQKPDTTRPCRTGELCPPPLASDSLLLTPDDFWAESPLVSKSGSSEGEGLMSGSLLPVPQALTDDQPVPSEPTFILGDWSPCSASCGPGKSTRSVDCKIFLEFSRTVAVLPDDECTGIPPTRSKTCMLANCRPLNTVRDAAKKPKKLLEDADTYDGARKTTNHIAFKPLTPRPFIAVTPQDNLYDAVDANNNKKSKNRLHSDEYSEGPFEFYHENSLDIDSMDGYDHGVESNEKAYRMSTPRVSTPRRDPFEWRSFGFGPCSATCLGGVQEMVVHCVRTSDDKVVGAHHCHIRDRPDIITQTCNDQPCPPRWRIGHYSNCTKPCGGGVKSRKVECISEITRANTNTMVVPASLCKQTQPPQQDSCNNIPCEATWHTQHWSKCSVPCGGGLKTRSLRCRQVLSNGQMVDQPPSKCSKKRPTTKRRCNKRRCPSAYNDKSSVNMNHFKGGRKPSIRSQVNQKYLQKKYMKKVKLKVGGEATVFRGVMVKVKCPVRHFDRSLITWWKEGQKLGKMIHPNAIYRTNPHDNIIVTTNGAIKINRIHYSDAGVYICKAGPTEANLTIHVKPLPSSFSSIDSSSAGTTASPGNRFTDGIDDDRSLNEVDSDVKYPPNYRQNQRTDWRTKEINWANRQHYNRDRNVKIKQNYRWRSNRRGRQRGRVSLPPSTPRSTGGSSYTPSVSFNLDEGPFKASSKNMHTVEETSGENPPSSPLEESFRTYLDSSSNKGTIIGSMNGTHAIIHDDSSTTRVFNQPTTREYVYGTLHGGNTATTGEEYPATSTPRRGMSLLTKKIGLVNNLDRTDSPKISEHVYGVETNWTNLSAGKDLFDDRVVDSSGHVYGVVSNSGNNSSKSGGGSTAKESFSDSLSSLLVSEEENNNYQEDTKATGYKVPMKALDPWLKKDEAEDSWMKKDEEEDPWLKKDEGEDSWLKKDEGDDFFKSSPQTSLEGYGDKLNSEHEEDSDDEHDLFSAKETPTEQPRYFENTHPLSSSLSLWGQYNPYDQAPPPRRTIRQHSPHNIAPWPAEPPQSPTSSSSGSGRNEPYLHSFLSSVKDSFGSSRGGRGAGEPSGGSNFFLQGASEGLFGTPEILGKGTRENLSFEWEITNWSECSQTCGYSGSPGGYQVRSTQCMVRVGNVSKSADAQLCEDAGLKAPPTIQDCGLTECPQWGVGDWSSCKKSRCFTLHYAYQRRKVTCETHTGSLTSPGQCDQVTKPRHRRECYNVDCVGVWRTGDWTDCMAPCGGQGYRTRLLQCVWNGTRRAAGNACRGEQRPEVVRWCDAQPCVGSDGGAGSNATAVFGDDCVDQSRYCNIAKRMNMCKVHYYKANCCRSCN